MRSAGFTLVEILVAVVVFGVLMLTVFSSFRSFIISHGVVKSSLAKADKMRDLTVRIVSDLQSLRISLPPEYGKPDFDSPSDRFRFSGDEISVSGSVFSRLRFVSLAHISSGGDPRTGVARIVYYVRQNRDLTFDLCRADAIGRFDGIDNLSCDPALCRDIKGFNLKFIDERGNEHENWDSESDFFDYATPVAVHVRIEYLYLGKLERIETLISLPVSRSGMD